MIAAVNDIKIASGVQLQIGRGKYLGFRCGAAVAAETTLTRAGNYYQPALPVEFQNAMRADVGVVEVALRVEREAMGIDQSDRRSAPSARTMRPR